MLEPTSILYYTKPDVHYVDPVDNFLQQHHKLLAENDYTIYVVGLPLPINSQDRVSVHYFPNLVYDDIKQYKGNNKLIVAYFRHKGNLNPRTLAQYSGLQRACRDYNHSFMQVDIDYTNESTLNEINCINTSGANLELLDILVVNDVSTHGEEYVTYSDIIGLFDRYSRLEITHTYNEGANTISEYLTDILDAKKIMITFDSLMALPKLPMQPRLVNLTLLCGNIPEFSNRGNGPWNDFVGYVTNSNNYINMAFEKFNAASGSKVSLYTFNFSTQDLSWYHILKHFDHYPANVYTHILLGENYDEMAFADCSNIIDNRKAWRAYVATQCSMYRPRLDATGYAFRREVAKYTVAHLGLLSDIGNNPVSPSEAIKLMRDGKLYKCKLVDTNMLRNMIQHPRYSKKIYSNDSRANITVGNLLAHCVTYLNDSGFVINWEIDDEMVKFVLTIYMDSIYSWNAKRNGYITYGTGNPIDIDVVNKIGDKYPYVIYDAVSKLYLRFTREDMPRLVEEVIGTECRNVDGVYHYRDVPLFAIADYDSNVAKNATKDSAAMLAKAWNAKLRTKE